MYEQRTGKAWHEERTIINGLMADVRKTVNLVDDGSGPYGHLVPTSFDYEMTVYGDAGDEIESPFDGLTIRWSRVGFSSVKSDYIAASVTGGV